MPNAPASDRRGWARYRPAAVEGVTLLDARFSGRAFDRHSHDTWSVGLTHAGVQCFRCGGSLHASHPGDLVLFNPDQAHDGQAGAPEGFAYRMAYLPASVLEGCSDAQARVRLARHFRSPVLRDPAVASRIGVALDALGQAGETLRAEALLREALSLLLRRHGDELPRAGAPPSAADARLERAREYLHAAYAEDVRVDTLAALAGLSRVQLSRAFLRRFGVPPHLMLNGIRLNAARAALLAGRPMAQVALECGFADQSHFSRRFRGAYGVPPGQWLRQVRAAAGR